MNEFPHFELLLTGGPGSLIEIPDSERAYYAAVSEDNPPTIAYILYTPLKFQSRLKAYLRESLKRKNIQVTRQIEVSSEFLESIYLESASKQVASVPVDLDRERYQDDVRALLSRATNDGASDIHIVRRRKNATVSFRINGRLTVYAEWTEIQADQTCRFIYEVMGHDQAVTWNRYEPQDAVLDTVLANSRRVRVRIGTIPTSPDGYDMVLRILPGSGDTMTLDELGYDARQMGIVHSLARRASGMVVIAGSVGSGKSTSIVGMLNEELEQHLGHLRIITVEDPPERVIPGASQVPVVRKKGISVGDEFSFAIRGALRCDPDTLMVGEIRDLQSALLTIKFAQSGHRVYTTIHASSALGIIGRLTGIGVERSLLCSPDILSGLIYQTLVPVLCSRCKVSIDEWLASAENDDRRKNFVYRIRKALLSRNKTVDQIGFRGTGCVACKHTGVQGRSVLAEIVQPDDALVELLRRGDLSVARQYWIENLGGKPVAEHGVQAIATGQASPLDVEWKIGPLNPTKLQTSDKFSSHLSGTRAA